MYVYIYIYIYMCYIYIYIYIYIYYIYIGFKKRQARGWARLRVKRPGRGGFLPRPSEKIWE